MKQIAWSLAWRLALALAVSWIAWRVGARLWGRAGLVLVVTSAPLYGLLLYRPLLDLASELRHGTRWLVWRAEEGRYYAYRGVQVRVVEDDDHVRWVRAADVRRIVGFTASDGALALTYPNGWARFGTPPEPYFSDDALLAHLRKESASEAGRFLVWAERTIAFPAQRLRAQRR